MLVGLGLLMACTSPEAQPQRLDRAIQTKLQGIALPMARHSTLEALAPGIRILLDDGTVEVDDLSLWAAVPPKAADAPKMAPGTEEHSSWTHVTGLKLHQQSERLVSIDQPLIDALSGAVHGARALLEARDAFEIPRVTFFADADTPFRDVVHVLYNGGQAELPEAQLAFRRPDGGLGSLPMSVPKFCAVRADAQHPVVHGEQCHQLSLHVDDDTISLRGHLSQQSKGCKAVVRAKMPAAPDPRPNPLAKALTPPADGSLALGFEGLLGPSEGDDSVRPTPPPPPPEPCVTVGIAAIADDPAALHRGMQQLAGGQEPCRQVTLSAGETTPWGQVLTTFDALWSLEHDLIYLMAGESDGRCESE